MTTEERKIALEKLNQDKKRKMQSLEKLLAEDKDQEILEKLEKSSKIRIIFLLFFLVTIFLVDYYFFSQKYKRLLFIFNIFFI